MALLMSSGIWMPSTGTTTAVAQTETHTATASRMFARADVETGTWLSEDVVDPAALTALPPSTTHPTGDTGNAYPFPQCTWWVYLRRHQLGLPVGSRFGNGAQWADSARRLGYAVDRTPRQGDIMVFARGQEDSSTVYGHVAIVEKVNKDGSVTTSESGARYHGGTFSRTFHNVGDFEYIHK